MSNSHSCFQRCRLYKDEGGAYNYKAVQRWTRPARLKGYGQLCASVLECDFIVVPVHQGIHWVCAVVDLEQQRFVYYDSLHVRALCAAALTALAALAALLRLAACVSARNAVVTVTVLGCPWVAICVSHIRRLRQHVLQAQVISAYDLPPVPMSCQLYSGVDRVNCLRPQGVDSEALQHLARWLSDEYQDKAGKTVDTSQWPHLYHGKDGLQVRGGRTFLYVMHTPSGDAV